MDSTINAIMKTINIVSQIDIPYWKNIIPRIPPLKNLQAFFFKYEISFFIFYFIFLIKSARPFPMESIAVNFKK